MRSNKTGEAVYGTSMAAPRVTASSAAPTHHEPTFLSSWTKYEVNQGNTGEQPESITMDMDCSTPPSLVRTLALGNYAHL